MANFETKNDTRNQ